MRYKKFHDTARLLKKSLPADLPVKIRRVIMPKDAWGDCSLEGDYYLIRVEKNVPDYLAIDILMHEYAHALSWNKQDDHSNSWGIAYAKIYRKYLEVWDIVHELKVAAKTKK